jgi:hypothetical protein
MTSAKSNVTSRVLCLTWLHPWWILRKSMGPRTRLVQHTPTIEVITSVASALSIPFQHGELGKGAAKFGSSGACSRTGAVWNLYCKPWDDSKFLMRTYENYWWEWTWYSKIHQNFILGFSSEIYSPSVVSTPDYVINPDYSLARFKLGPKPSPQTFIK